MFLLLSGIYLRLTSPSASSVVYVTTPDLFFECQSDDRSLQPFLRGGLSTFASAYAWLFHIILLQPWYFNGSISVTMMSRLMLNLHETADAGLYSTNRSTISTNIECHSPTSHGIELDTLWSGDLNHTPTAHGQSFRLDESTPLASILRSSRWIYSFISVSPLFIIATQCISFLAYYHSFRPVMYTLDIPAVLPPLHIPLNKKKHQVTLLPTISASLWASIFDIFMAPSQWYPVNM